MEVASKGGAAIHNQGRRDGAHFGHQPQFSAVVTKIGPRQWPPTPEIVCVTTVVGIESQADADLAAVQTAAMVAAADPPAPMPTPPMPM